MDTNMMDIDGDIILDVEPGMEAQDFQMQQPDAEVQNKQRDDNGDAPMPAAYFESLEAFKAYPETLNLQGVNDFGPNDPLDYALEHCPERKPKRLRWVNDNSVNIEYYSSHDATDALLVLTHPDAGVAALIPAQTSRQALPYSKKPDSALVIREANSGDQKERHASERSEFYRKNPQARERDAERRRERRKPVADILDYGDEGVEQNEHNLDTTMGEDHPPRNGDRRRRQTSRRENSGPVRTLDSYRPGSDSPGESRYGRLRGRSASPASDQDGRLGFAENGSSYRSYRSRSRDRQRRRPSHSREREFRKRSTTLETSRWERDRFDENDTGRLNSDTFNSPMSNHRRSDATDQTNFKGSLLSRMTKDGKPVIPTRSLASRITRDMEPEPNQGRLKDDYGEPLSKRMTRNVKSDTSYGRLKDDYSEPREDSYQAPTTKGNDLANRITWVRDRGGNGRSSDRDRSHENVDDGDEISIRGSASQIGGYSIRGAAGGG